MSTNFPVALDTFNDPSPTDALGGSAPPHSAQHTNLNDAVAALEAKVGIGGSTDPSSLDYMARNPLEQNYFAGLMNNITGTVLVPIAALTAEMVAGQHYVGEMTLKCKSSNHLNGLQFDFGGGTAQAAGFSFVSEFVGTATPGTLAGAAGSPSDVLNFTDVANVLLVTIKFLFSCSQSGTFVPRFCINANNGVGYAELYDGYMRFAQTVN